MHFKRHFFVCTERRPPFAKPSCALRGSAELQHALATAVAAAGLTEVGVSGSTCLGPCLTGASVVVYPEGVWYRGVTAADVPELVLSHAIAGVPVERLRESSADDGRSAPTTVNKLA